MVVIGLLLYVLKVKLPDIQNQKKSNEKRKTKKKQINHDPSPTNHESQTVIPLNINPQQPRKILPSYNVNHSRTISAPAPMISNGMPQLTKYTRSNAKSLININSSTQTLQTKSTPTVVLKSTKKQPLNTQLRENLNGQTSRQNHHTRYGSPMTNLSINGENGFNRYDPTNHQNRILIKQNQQHRYFPIDINHASTDNRSYATANFARDRIDYSANANRPSNPHVTRVIVNNKSDRPNDEEYAISSHSERDQNHGPKIPSTKYVAHEIKTGDTKKENMTTRETSTKSNSRSDRKESADAIDAFLDAVINKSKNASINPNNGSKQQTSKGKTNQDKNNETVKNKSSVKDTTKDSKEKRNLKVRFAESEQNGSKKENEITSNERISDLIARYPELADTTDDEEKTSKIPKLATVMVDSLDLKEGAKTREIIATDPERVKLIDATSTR